MAEPASDLRVLERCRSDRLLVMPGRNLWILARTDRDAPTPEDVTNTAGAFLLRVLGYASPSGYDRTEIIQDPDPPAGSLAAWFIGAARPTLVTRVSQTYPVNVVPEDARRLGRSIECQAVRLIKADRSWYVVVEFDWRGPQTFISWPASKVSALGIRSQDTRNATDLDWLVVEAWHRGAAKLPDSTLGHELGEYVEEKAEEIADAAKNLATSGVKTVAVVAGAALVLLLAYGWSKRG